MKAVFCLFVCFIFLGAPIFCNFSGLGWSEGLCDDGGHFIPPHPDSVSGRLHQSVWPAQWSAHLKLYWWYELLVVLVYLHLIVYHSALSSSNECTRSILYRNIWLISTSQGGLRLCAADSNNMTVKSTVCWVIASLLSFSTSVCWILDCGVH